MLTLTRSVSEDADTRPRLRVLKSLFEPNCEPSPVASLLSPHRPRVGSTHKTSQCATSKLTLRVSVNCAILIRERISSLTHHDRYLMPRTRVRWLR